ncbi:hypothetical protein CL617_03130 [archaeon]|nr:hypothetical protein [archaeon]|tara:strand:+ start:30839 stop:32176 length:1338 start_codon:yes stop_codon:yes gene_type:complete
MKKLGLALIFVALVMLTFVTPNVNAAAEYSFRDIEVNGVDLDLITQDSTTINVEKGDEVRIRVELRANGDATKQELDEIEDLKVKAWIGGYEFGDIEDETNLFDLSPGTTKVKTLTLNIPNDISSSKTYKLHIEAFDREDRISASFPLDLEEKRHDVNLFRVFFTPGLTVQTGDFLSIGAIVENFGGFSSGERNVIVEASIPSLGLATADSIDRLDTEAKSKDDADRDDSAKLDLPPLSLNNVAPGNYELKVKVFFNRGRTVTEEAYTLTVIDEEVTPGSILQNSIVNVDSTSKDLTTGQATAYTVMIGNLGDSIRTFTAEVEGTQTFANTRIEPAIIAVQPGSTSQITLFVVPNDDAQAGKHIFSLRVREGTSLVKELNLEGNVISASPATGAGALSNVKTGLQIGFIVLLIILVILGIVIAANKARGNKDDVEESSGEEQTYY